MCEYVFLLLYGGGQDICSVQTQIFLYLIWKFSKLSSSHVGLSSHDVSLQLSIYTDTYKCCILYLKKKSANLNWHIHNTECAHTHTLTRIHKTNQLMLYNAWVALKLSFNRPWLDLVLSTKLKQSRRKIREQTGCYYGLIIHCTVGTQYIRTHRERERERA